ncbi:MAG: endolytic transglycosylase MltG [Janthinobacterium lividum]
MRAFLGTLLALILLIGGSAFYVHRQYEQPGPLQDMRALIVPRGGIGEVADTLAREGVIASPVAFQAAALVTSGAGALHAGELEFPAGISLRDVLNILRTAKPIQHLVTIPEGLTAIQVTALLDRTPLLDGAVAVPPEGSLLPETYAFDRGTTRTALIERATKAMGRALDRAWAARSPTLPLDSPHDALILASIVERETAKPEERPRVAAVFLNRLRQGMKLQSDATVVYGVSGGAGALDHGLTRSELEQSDPYNTYRIAGLPPGPIAMPGAASLHAVTQPMQSNELFFVADGTGGHVFAQTQEEHLRNVAHWRGVERARRQP